MNEPKLAITSEKDIKINKTETNKSELEVISDIELKDIDNNYHKSKSEIVCTYIFCIIIMKYIYLINGREEKIKIIKGEAPRIEEDKNKNGFLDYKNIPRKVSIYK